VTDTAVGVIVVMFVVIFGGAGLVGLALALVRGAVEDRRYRRSRLQAMDAMPARDE
jgi:hypothetical protein